MNCVDLQRSLAGVEDLSTAEHMRTCLRKAGSPESLRSVLGAGCGIGSHRLRGVRIARDRRTQPSGVEFDCNRFAAGRADSSSGESALCRVKACRLKTGRVKQVPRVTSRGVPTRDIAASAASSRGFSSFAAGWGWRGWLVPAAAALLIAVGFFVNQRSLVHQLTQHIAPPALPRLPPEALRVGIWLGLNDDDLLQEIQNQSPEMRAQYVDNLRSANEYIRDAQSVVDANPNDEESRRSLLEAYQQKAMLFEMAMDRSLP